MELWDAYNAQFEQIEGMTLVRGEEDQIPPGIYHLICDVLVRHADGTFLLMQRDPRKPFPMMWEATAGGSALQGESPEECAVRELKEETGITASKLEELTRMVIDRAHGVYVEFLCITDCDKDSVVLQEGETIAYQWLTGDEICRMPDNEFLSQRMKKFIIGLTYSGYLKETETIDYSHPLIQEKVKELKDQSASQLNYIENAYRFVRDEIPHSWDIRSETVSRKASDVLRNGTGICWTKSCLLSALLRAENIPSGISYQYLTRADDNVDEGYIIHALNTVYLSEQGRWIRLDARGNKENVHAEFSLDEERLAFPIREELEECDYRNNDPDLDDRLIEILKESTNILNVEADFKLYPHEITIEEIPLERISEFWEIHIRYLIDDGIISDEEDIEYFQGEEYRGILKDHMIRDRDRHHMVYFCRDGERIGAASYCTYQSEDGKCFILDYWVFPPFRGNGTGHCCFAALEEYTKADGAKYYELNSTKEDSIRFWKSLGFAENGTDEYDMPVFVKKQAQEGH